MNIRDLKYLIAVADHRHFGKAALACHVSQPALSMQLKKLEEVLGVQLIERSNKSVSLTQVGELVTQQARDILEHVDAIHVIASQSKDPYSGELRIGIIPTLAPYFLPHLLPKLSKIFPKLVIYLAEEKTSDLLTKLASKQLDCAIVALPIAEENFIYSPLFEEEFVLAVPASHPLSKKKIIERIDLENKDLLLLEDGHCMRDQALSFCHQSQVLEFKNFQATSLETLRHMVASGVGITLMPRLSCRLNDGVCYLPFSSPQPIRTIGIVWRPSSAKKIALGGVANQIRTIMAKQKLVRVIKPAN